MFQLNFYPHLDLQHTAFRALCIGRHVLSVPVDAYRLFDFFLMFPFELRIIRQRGARLKKLADQFEIYRPYRWSSEPLQTFLQMAEFQSVAVRALARKRVINPTAFDGSRFELSEDYKLEKTLASEVESFLEDRSVVLNVLTELLAEHGTTGADGLKARSGLMPFKYDAKKNVILD